MIRILAACALVIWAGVAAAQPLESSRIKEAKQILSDDGLCGRSLLCKRFPGMIPPDVRVRSCVRPVRAAHLAAGPDGIRGSGLYLPDGHGRMARPSPSFEVSRSPGPTGDIMSSALANSVQSSVNSALRFG